MACHLQSNENEHCWLCRPQEAYVMRKEHSLLSCFQFSFSFLLFPKQPNFFPSAICSLHKDELLTPQTLPDYYIDMYLLSQSRHGIFLFSQSIQTNVLRLNLIYWFSFGVLTSHCKTASLCWACGTRTAEPGGILLLWSRRLYPGLDPRTLTVLCLSPFQSTDAPVSSRKNKIQTVNVIRWPGSTPLNHSYQLHSPFMILIAVI